MSIPGSNDGKKQSPNLRSKNLRRTHLRSWELELELDRGYRIDFCLTGSHAVDATAASLRLRVEMPLFSSRSLVGPVARGGSAWRRA